MTESRMTDSFRKALEEGARGLELELSEEQKEQLYRYYEMVTERNKVMNLTAITEEGEFVQKHLIDSLAIVKAGEAVTEILAAGDIEVIDVGTGAGLPGIVLKICYPGLRMTLFDSLKKRLRRGGRLFRDDKREGLGRVEGRYIDKSVPRRFSAGL